MNTKHTPGPWKVISVDWTQSGNARFEIEGIHRTGIADARLISAAPELLEALQRIADGQEMSGTYTFGDVVLRYQEIARAAIAKAVSS